MTDLRVLILEDEMVIARDLNNILRKIGIRNTLIVNDSTEMVNTYTNFLPHLVLADINLEEDYQDGITLCKQMLQKINTHVIFITANANDDYLIRAQGLKPLNYLLKPFDEDQVATTITLALSKQEVQEGGFLKQDYSELFTESEFTILKLIAQKKTTAEIAEQLFISPKTVENHRRNISQKLNLSGRNNSLLSWALEHKREF
ncbi:MAG TPA: DNA-binding response regulator [Balneolaceae bacterium]|nr:DNA-binding response regulator [Balneolaceae bacterium]|tara:strand:+ start:22014 stop:22622 length:609 start_codon:yes stop_codon:yes gene_type:complete